MEIPQFGQWTPSDAAGVSQFLATPLGQKFMMLLHNCKPRTTIDKGVESAGVTGAYTAGYELCILQIYSSCNVVQEVDFTAKTADMTKD
jgi:hypothetical protein